MATDEITYTEPKGVPAEGVPLSNYLHSSKLRLRTTGPSAGTPLRPLRRTETWVKRRPDLYPLLEELLGSHSRAEMVVVALAIQMFAGSCYASARFIAGRTCRTGTCWDRCLARLRELDLVRTWRLQRPDGHLSTNLIDLRRLWELLLKLLAQKRLRFEWIGRTLWLKVGGVWATVAGLAGTLGSASRRRDTTRSPAA